MGRTPLDEKEKKQLKSVALRPGTWRELKEEADRENRSMNSLIEFIILRHLEKKA